MVCTLRSAVLFDFPDCDYRDKPGATPITHDAWFVAFRPARPRIWDHFVLGSDYASVPQSRARSEYFGYFEMYPFYE